MDSLAQPKHQKMDMRSGTWNVKSLYRLKLKGTHQLLAYADDINILGENTDTIQKNTEALIDASKKAGLEVNPAKTKYTLM
jgi:hypothetical protein